VPNVYSVVIAALGAASAGSTDLGTPPPGHKWVIKDICVTKFGGQVYPDEQFVVEDVAGAVIFSEGRGLAVIGHTFRWQGSQVIEQGTNLFFVATHAGWSLRISGYNLVLP
jgi:hypothetical protein